MKTIWKYQIEIKDAQDLMMPDGAEILTTQIQKGRLCLWAKVNTEAPRVRREIEIIGTGHPIEDARRKYIGTVQDADGWLVWHVLERLGQPS